MSYVRPSPLAADASWQSAPAYSRPSPLAADASFATGGDSVTAHASAPPALGVPAVTATFWQDIAALVAAATPMGVPSVHASTVAAFVAVATPLGAPAARGRKGQRNRLVKNQRYGGPAVVGYAQSGIQEGAQSPTSEPGPSLPPDLPYAFMADLSAHLGTNLQAEGIVMIGHDDWLYEFRGGKWVPIKYMAYGGKV